MPLCEDRWLSLEDDTRLNYAEQGTGRPVLMVHGWSGNNTTYAPFAQAIADNGFHYIAPNMRGSKPTEHSRYLPATIMQLADDLHFMMETLALEEVTLVGHSQGGQDIMAYLSKYGCAHLHSVVLIDTTPANHQVPGFLPEYDGYSLSQGYRECAEMAEDMVGYFANTFMGRAFPDASEAELRALAAGNLERQWLDETLSLYASAIILNATAFPERVTVPLAYFFAKNGVLIPPAMDRWYREHLSDYVSHPFPSASHTFFQEPEHSSRFLEELLAFLRQ